MQRSLQAFFAWARVLQCLIWAANEEQFAARGINVDFYHLAGTRSIISCPTLMRSNLKTEKYVRELACHFDPSRSTITNFAQFKDAVAEIFAPEVSAASVIMMSGAPVGSTLTLSIVLGALHPPSVGDPANKAEITPPGLMVKVENENYLTEPNYVIFYKESAARRGIYIHLVMFKGGKALAIGGLMIMAMLNGIKSLGGGVNAFKVLSLLAAGGRVWGDMSTGGRWNGFKSWPRYGFDMQIAEGTLDTFPLFENYPRNLASCRRVSALLALDGGPDFWAMVGDGYYMEFRVGSRISRCRLTSELKRRYT